MRNTRSTLVRILGNAWIPLLYLALFLTTAPIASAQTTVYAITNTGVFGTLNLSTGTFTQIGNTDLAPAGLAGLGSNLFAASVGGSALFLVNPANGNLTTVGSGSITYDDFGATTASLYGIGTNNDLYSINPATGAATLIGPTGLTIAGNSVAMSSNAGVLYLTLDTGSGSILYSVNTATGTASTIGSTGLSRIGSMVYANGLLYAAPHNGTLYTVNTQTGAATFVANTGQILWGMAFPASTYTVLHNFTGGSAGSNPFAGLAINASGNLLYGTTGAGGSGTCSYSGLTGCGTVFKLALKNGAWTFNPLYSFQGGSTDGEFPVRPVTIGPNGTLYGATLGGGLGTCTFDGDTGCGIVFNVAPHPTVQASLLAPWVEKVLYRFTGESDGGIAFTTLVFDSSGNMYGTTISGGANNLGTVFELSPSGNNWVETVLYSFAGGSDGEGPYDGLIADGSGNFYGTTAGGGGSSHCTNGCGTVFKLTPSGGGNYTESVLYSFSGPTDGENPNAGVVMDAAGNLYGNTWQGGPGGGGTVYKLTPSGGGNYTFSLLYSVVGNGYSVGRMALDSNGNLYGVLQNGGAFNNAGQVFELTPSNGSWIYTDLYDFTGGSDGGNPIGGVVRDSSGNLYGTALFGGANSCGGGSYGCGDIFEITPN